MRNTQHENTDRKSHSQQAGRMANETRGETRTSGNDRPRDAEGRFVDEDDSGNRRASSLDNGNDDQPRDAQGRFTDDDDQSGSRRSASGRDGHDDQPRDSQGRFIEDDDDKGSRSRN